MRQDKKILDRITNINYVPYEYCNADKIIRMPDFSPDYSLQNYIMGLVLRFQYQI